MRKLHLVGLTTDRDGLIFTARKGSKSGGYIVPLDDKVLSAIAEARAGGNGSPAAAGDAEAVPKRLRSESALTPREMQARLRGGRSIEEVAAEAGVDTEWVARFAVPILAEQAQVVELARALTYAKPRLGESSQPLGASVQMNLTDRGVFLPDDIASAAWSAFQLHDSVWMVRFRYRSRGRDHEAQWEIDVPTGRLLARNRHASDLGYVEYGRRRRDVEAELEHGEAHDDAPAPRPRRRRAAAPATVTPTRAAARKRAAPAPAPVKARTRRPPAVPARAAKAAKAVKPAATAAKAGRKAAAKSVASKAPAKAAGKAVTAKATSRKAAAPVKKAAGRRRPAKAAPADAGPTAGTGGVRMAVAQVSTARVKASLAAADRAPWAAAVRRPPAPRTSPLVNGADGNRPAARRAAPAREERRDMPAFQPRPLPPPGREPAEPRVRKVEVSTRQPPADGGPGVSLPKPIERPKRRRLRSR